MIELKVDSDNYSYMNDNSNNDWCMKYYKLANTKFIIVFIYQLMINQKIIFFISASLIFLIDGWFFLSFMVSKV